MIRKTLIKQIYAYPVRISKLGEQGFLFYIIDLMETEFATTVVEGLSKVRELIGRKAYEMERNSMVMPPPSTFDEVIVRQESDSLITFIDVDFEEYRRKLGSRVVHKNVSIPEWMEYEAENEGLSLSRVLQEAIREKLRIEEERDLF